MKKILSIVLKSLFVVLVLLCLSFGTLIFIRKSSFKPSMELISSSLFNTIKTNEKEKNNEDKEEVEEAKEDDKEEVKVEKKEEVKEVIKEELKPEVKPQEQPKQQEPVQQEPQQQQPQQTQPSVPNPVGGYNPNLEVANTVGVSATYTGLVTAYGPDCYGCGSGETATGYNVSNGNIYYNHPTYGTIRIVAGDRSILRRVVRITGLNISSEPILAIVLDTGGDIGFNKPKGIILDLLFTSEKSSEVLNFGMQKATVEVLN